MHAGSILRPNAISLLPPSALEAGLLELFAPTSLLAPTDISLPRRDHARLWRDDAIHRAKNMAQLSTSFADVADHPSRRWLPTEVIAQARCLSRAYEELGAAEDVKVSVPCAALLTEIATRLGSIFGRSRQVLIVVSSELVFLPASVRRALLLIGSELIINALKYAYPNEAGGTISVSLAARAGEVELIVEDDGIGIVETYSAGHGGGLLEQLSVMLDATVSRTTGGLGHGFRVSTLVSINTSQFSDA